jgi:protein arginine kinase
MRTIHKGSLAMILRDENFDHCPWLSSGNGDSSQVVSSRIRLARNLEGYPFSNWAGPRDLHTIAQLIMDALPLCKSLAECEIIDLGKIEENDRIFLAERYLISREQAAEGKEKFVIVRSDQRLSIMINEEDHLRIQCICPGQALQEAWQQISQVDDDLDRCLRYAFSSQLGYLTACPTNIGTGIRCSIMLHLPALVLCKKIQKMLAAAQESKLMVRGMGGEGSKISGNLFQISNQQTLGISEERHIERIEKLVGSIVEWECRALEQLRQEADSLVEDTVWRAYGILRHTRSISSHETRELLSALRLGVHLGIITNIDIPSLNQLMICSGPAHLQKIAGNPLDTQERDRMRADFIRGKINLN